MGTAIQHDRSPKAQIINRSLRAPQVRAVGGSHLGSGLGERRGLPSGVRAEPPPPAILSSIEIISQLIFGHQRVSIQLQRWANRDKSRTPSQKRNKWASLENCDFVWDTSLKFGIVPENPGRMVTLLVESHWYTANLFICVDVCSKSLRNFYPPCNTLYMDDFYLYFSLR